MATSFSKRKGGRGLDVFQNKKHFMSISRNHMVIY